jgi:hypothetical protein
MRRLTDITKDLRKELKAKYPRCKFSVTTKHGHDITVALMSAPTTPFATLDTISAYDPPLPQHDGTYRQLNHYHITQDHLGRWTSNGAHLKAKYAKMLLQVIKLANEENYNNSDLMTDYFDVGYWFHLAIGKWNKPFTIS